jgi:AraC family transcriptional regulator
VEDWTQAIQNALEYVEEHLAGELEICEISRRAFLSPFYFQRIFSTLCGLGVGEYIRYRRLTLAAQELCSTDAKVIDVAAKYGYNSPDGFSRAFQRFHGVPPSAAKKAGASLKTFAPVRIKLTLEGGSMLEYKIVEKSQFTVVGLEKTFHPDTSYEEIPKFWREVMEMEHPPVCGMYGICIDVDEQGKDFLYWIADNYIPWQEIPTGCTAKVIPASTWAVFPCRGALPKALQEVNTRIWSEWLPNCKTYRLAGNYNVEMYAPPQPNPEDNYCEIWLPVEKALE